MTHRITRLAAVAAAAVALAGCADLTPREQRAMTGAAAGAAGGALIGSMTGSWGWGAAIGAGVGAAGGLLTDHVVTEREAAYNRGVAAGRAQRN
jgi:uncharacterized membrane protein